MSRKEILAALLAALIIIVILRHINDPGILWNFIGGLSLGFILGDILA